MPVPPPPALLKKKGCLWCHASRLLHCVTWRFIVGHDSQSAEASHDGFLTVSARLGGETNGRCLTFRPRLSPKVQQFCSKLSSTNPDACSIHLPSSLSISDSALGLINSSYSVETLISQISSHQLVAVASLRHLSEQFGLCSSMYSDSVTGK